MMIKVGVEEVYLHRDRLLRLLYLDSENLLPYTNPVVVVSELEAGRYDLFVCGNGDSIDLYFLTQKIDYPCCSVLLVVWVGGQNAEQHLPIVFEELENYCRNLGIDRLEAYGRKGWERLFRSNPSIKIRQVVYVKDIE